MDAPIDPNTAIPASGPVQLAPLSAGRSGAPSLPANLDAEALLELLDQQQSAVGDLFLSLGTGSTGVAAPALSQDPRSDSPAAPSGAAIDFLLNSPQPGAGEIFNLALPGFNSSVSIPGLAAANAAGAQQAYLDASALFQLVEDARQSNMATLLSLGSGSLGPGNLL